VAAKQPRERPVLRGSTTAFRADGECQVSESGTRYGFEMVDARSRTLQLRNPHQSKIYAESNRSAFLQIFRDIASMQTLAVYRCGLRKGSIARSTATE
jgi:hypothetical protein